MRRAEMERRLAEAFRQGGPAALRAACGQVLAGLRGVDGPGAAALLDQDPELAALWARLAATDPGEMAAALAFRLAGLARTPACLGCGTCCRTSSPTLYAEDLGCLGPRGLGRAQLITLRSGEVAYSARLGRSFTLEAELIKLREGPQGECLFLQGSRCGIYEGRPLQCRHLECWSGAHAGQLEERPRLVRRDIYAGDSTALALIEEYEIKLPAGELTALLERAAAAGEEGPEGDQSAREALELMELDGRLRAGISGRYGYPTEELDLLLGRPSWELGRGHGLFLEIVQEGRPRLLRRQLAPN